MADHYRALTQTLVNLGFLFRRQGVGRREVWRNRQTDQEVTFDRDEVAKSRAAADAVLTAAQAVPAGKSAKAAESAASAKPPRKSAPSSKPVSKTASKAPSKPSSARATPRKGVKRTARRKGTR